MCPRLSQGGLTINLSRMALFSGRTVLSRALRVVGVRHEHILSSIIGKTDPPAKWAVGPGEVGQVVVIGGGAIGSLMAGRIAAVPGMEKRVWMLTSWVEHAQVPHAHTMLSYSQLHQNSSALRHSFAAQNPRPRPVCGPAISPTPSVLIAQL